MRVRVGQFDARRRGAVLFMVIVAMTLLVGVLFFALNAGTQVNRRLEMQNASDAAVVGGAGWVARGMNMIAMNNCAMARMITMAAVFDSMPIAAEMTIAEQNGDQELSEALSEYVTVGRRFTPYEEDNFFRIGLAELYRQLDEQANETDLDIVTAIDAQFNQRDEFAREINGYDVGKVTQWEYHGSVSYYFDNDGPDFTKAGTWERRNIAGQRSPASYITDQDGAFAVWSCELPTSERYDISVYFGELEGLKATNSAVFTVSDGINGFTATVDMSSQSNIGRWVRLDEMDVVAGRPVKVTLKSKGRNYVIADTVKFTTDEPDTRIGYLWRAALAMDDFSKTTLSNLTRRAQENAHLSGWQNGAVASFTIPVNPSILCDRKDFGSFEAVLTDHVEYDRDTGYVVSSDLTDYIYDSQDVASALREKKNSDGSIARIKGWGAFPDYVAGGAIPDFEFPHRLGPFASLYRWRFPWDDWQVTFQQRTGYTAYGPYEHAMRQVLDGFGQAGWYWDDDGISETSRFSYHLRTVTKAKLAMMFHHVRYPNSENAGTLSVQYSNKWITDYEEAAEYYADEHTSWTQTQAEYQKQLEEAQENGTAVPEPPYFKSDIMTTRYYRVNVKSTVSCGSDYWMNEEYWQDGEATLTFVPRRWFSWQLNEKGPFDDASKFHLQRWIYDRTGWHSMGNTRDGTAVPTDKWDNGIWYQLAKYVWARKRMYKALWDRELNLDRRLKDPNQSPPYSDDDYEPYTLYSFEIRVFGGIELRNEVPVRDLLKGAKLADLPAPILLNTSTYDYDDDHDEPVRRNGYTYLGVAARGGKARVWPKQFTLGNPSGMISSVSQAIIFNNSSWDLWTQDWQVKLVPVTDWKNWQERMASDLEKVDDISGSNPDDIRSVMEYQMKLDPKLMNTFLSH